MKLFIEVMLWTVLRPLLDPAVDAILLAAAFTYWLC